MLRAMTAAAIILTACAPTAVEEDEVPNDLPGPTGEQPCGAEGYQGFVGKPLAAVTYPSDMKVRIVEPGMIMTMEYIATRMNIKVDEDGMITRVYCG
ncbi:hypothetical protein HK107_01995 [Parvularcula sp. ZS-1/3]|uniref:Peptidase inhibitor I78 family protein n=1 Tax=Parvularcula mediterranea TaxID=2732508 RepID=A0A7Y3W3T9_9PROT|nr:I78 family peptidase inhibitor [Parvularcula mediterranea]NNU15095.1 hypothetical protein [Parvularcula mediterranea]